MATQPLLSAADSTLQSNDDLAAPQPRRKQRLVSLDGIRGLTVALMIFVDNLGSWFPKINHSPWDYVTLADFVMPFFLFMVGCSMSLSFKKYKAGVLWKVIKRTGKLFVLGLLTQGSGFPGLGNDGYDLKAIRIPGILQRIAWAYLCVALIALYVPQRGNGKADGYFRVFKVHGWQWLVALSFLVGYLVVLLVVPIPSWSYVYNGVTLHVKCDVAGDLSPACSATRWVDEKLLGWNHLFHHGVFQRTNACSTCSPDFCAKPLRCPTNTTCPKGVSEGARFSFSHCKDCPDDFFAANWCGARLDPEGSLASMGTIVTTYTGYHFGMVLQHFPAHADRLKQWVPFALGLLISGFVVQAAWWPASKQLWSPAYTLIMAGANGLLLVAFYCLLDFTTWQPSWMRRKWKPIDTSVAAIGVTDVLRPFVWVGMNTIFVYLLSPSGGLWERLQSNVYWDTPDNNLIDATYRNVFCHHPAVQRGGQILDEDHCHVADGCMWNQESVCQTGLFTGQEQRWAMLVWIILRICFWIGVAGVLHYRGWYWAL